MHVSDGRDYSRAKSIEAIPTFFDGVCPNTTIKIIAMKKSILAPILFAILLACSPEVEQQSKSDMEKEARCKGQVLQFPQQWHLVRMSGNMVNSETTGMAMPWQESILLNSDNSFIKTRQLPDETIESSGTYTVTTNEIDKSIQLTLLYEWDTRLVGNCFGEPLKEAYMLDSTCKLRGTWAMCDGPGLEYEMKPDTSNSDPSRS